MQRIDFSLNGKFGSFVSKLVKKKGIEEQNIPESKFVQNCIRQPEKDKKTLNKIIQRLIAVELTKHREKERMSIKKTYSDSKTVVHETANKKMRQLININPLMSSLEVNKKSKSYLQKDRSEKTKELLNNAGKNATFPDETVEGFLRNDEPDKAGEVEIFRAERETDENLENVDPIRRELKLDIHNTQIPIGNLEDRFVTNNRIYKKKIQDQKDNSTQTEHYYLVRIVRSCPVQKKHLTSYVNLHLNQSTNTKKTPNNAPMKDLVDINLSPIIQRKASENLIYEKHKGSASPSYISSPERFRWKYVSSTKKKEDT